MLRDDVSLSAVLPRRAVEALRAAYEVTRRHHLAEDNRPRLSSPDAIYRYLMPQLAHLPVERFVVLSLNARNALLGLDIVAEGSVDQCHVDPRDVFRAALAQKATGIVVGHNHPSNDAEPSEHDVALSRRLAASAEMLCIRFLDSLVITSAGFISMQGRGLLLPGLRL